MYFYGQNFKAPFFVLGHAAIACKLKWFFSQQPYQAMGCFFPGSLRLLDRLFGAEITWEKGKTRRFSAN